MEFKRPKRTRVSSEKVLLQRRLRLIVFAVLGTTVALVLPSSGGLARSLPNEGGVSALQGDTKMWAVEFPDEGVSPAFLDSFPFVRGADAFEYVVRWSPEPAPPLETFTAGLKVPTQPGEVRAELRREMRDAISSTADGILTRGDVHNKVPYLRSLLDHAEPFVLDAIQVYTTSLDPLPASLPPLPQGTTVVGPLGPHDAVRDAQATDGSTAESEEATAADATSNSEYKTFGPHYSFQHFSGGWGLYTDIDGRKMPKYRIYHYPYWLGWNELRAFGNSNDGFEIQSSFTRCGGFQCSGESAGEPYNRWVNEMPGAYKGMFYLDDTYATFESGSHEAEKLKPQWWYEVWVEFTDRATEHYGSMVNKPKIFASAQYDLAMSCGNSYADFCFFSDGGKQISKTKAYWIPDRIYDTLPYGGSG